MNIGMLLFTCARRCMVASLRCMRGISTKVLLHLPFRTLVRFTLRTLVDPPRSPLTSTQAKHAVPPPTFPTSHTPKRSIRPSTLHSNPPLCLPLQLRIVYCTPYLFAILDLRHLSPFLPTQPAQHVHEVRRERRPLLVVKLGDALKQTVSLSVQAACKICSRPQSRFKSRGTRSHMTCFNLQVNSILPKPNTRNSERPKRGLQEMCFHRQTGQSPESVAVIAPLLSNSTCGVKLRCQGKSRATSRQTMEPKTATQNMEFGAMRVQATGKFVECARVVNWTGGFTNGPDPSNLYFRVNRLQFVVSRSPVCPPQTRPRPQLCCCLRWSATPLRAPSCSILCFEDEGALHSWTCYASVTANEKYS